MSTRSSIWLGEDRGKRLHIYWELAERETESGKITGVPIYLSIADGDEDKEVSIRLPKDLAIRILVALSDNFAEEVGQVI